jgi:hypothetical protein
VDLGDSLMLVPGKQALLLCMSVITKRKPVLTLMKKSEVEAFHEVSVFAKAGGARFQYTLLKFSCPRRSAFSTTPLSVVTTWTYLRAFRGGGAGLQFRGARGAAAEEAGRRRVSLRGSKLLRSRLVSWHVAAADLEAAVVVGFAVQVVPALAAYERGVEGLVDRQAHSVFVWRALL